MRVRPLLALALVFEEWGWEPLAALLARLARLPFWAWLERQIRALPRWGALLVFGVPVLGLLPVKLLGLYLLGHGHVWLSLAVLVGAKVAGTAVAARPFQLTQPALQQFGWIAHWDPRRKNLKRTIRWPRYASPCPGAPYASSRPMRGVCCGACGAINLDPPPT